MEESSSSEIWIWLPVVLKSEVEWTISSEIANYKSTWAGIIKAVKCIMNQLDNSSCIAWITYWTWWRRWWSTSAISTITNTSGTSETITATETIEEIADIKASASTIGTERTFAFKITFGTSFS